MKERYTVTMAITKTKQKKKKRKKELRKQREQQANKDDKSHNLFSSVGHLETNPDNMRLQSVSYTTFGGEIRL